MLIKGRLLLLNSHIFLFFQDVCFWPFIAFWKCIKNLRFKLRSIFSIGPGYYIRNIPDHQTSKALVFNVLMNRFNIFTHYTMPNMQSLKCQIKFRRSKRKPQILTSNSCRRRSTSRASGTSSSTSHPGCHKPELNTSCRLLWQTWHTHSSSWR